MSGDPRFVCDASAGRDARRSARRFHEGALFAIAVLASYSPVVLGRYAFLDDYPLLAAFSPSFPRDSPPSIVQHTHALGRPTTAILYDLGFGAASSVEGLWIVRFQAVIALTLLGLTFDSLLRRMRWRRLDAACTSFLVVTLPAFQVYAAWAAASFYVLACLLACVAAALVERSSSVKSPAAFLGLLAATVLQSAAFTIYQPAAMFFVVAAAVVAFPADSPRVRARALLASGAVLAAAMAVGFAVYQAGMRQVPTETLGERASMVVDPGLKLRWFLSEALRDALNLHNLRPTFEVAAIVATVTATGILIRFRPPILGVAAAVAMTVCSYIPNLLVRENWSAYRTQPALASMVLILLVMATDALPRKTPLRLARRSGLVGAALVAAALTFWNTRELFARPQARELALLRSRLPAAARWEGRIVVTKARWHDSIAPYVRYDEFGLPSSAAEYTIEPMIRLIALERDADTAGLIIRVSADGATGDSSRGSLVLDLRELGTSD